MDNYIILGRRKPSCSLGDDSQGRLTDKSPLDMLTVPWRRRNGFKCRKPSMKLILYWSHKWLNT